MINRSTPVHYPPTFPTTGFIEPTTNVPTGSCLGAIIARSASKSVDPLDWYKNFIPPLYSTAHLQRVHLIIVQRDIKVWRLEQTLNNIIESFKNEQKTLTEAQIRLVLRNVHRFEGASSDRSIKAAYKLALKTAKRLSRRDKGGRSWPLKNTTVDYSISLLHPTEPVNPGSHDHKVYQIYTNSELFKGLTRDSKQTEHNVTVNMFLGQDSQSYLNYVRYCESVGTKPLSIVEWDARRIHRRDWGMR